MAAKLDEWVRDHVEPLKQESVRWLSAEHFFRDPPRPSYSDTSLLFSPADGIILYQKVVSPDDPIVDIKGVPYSLCAAFRSETIPDYDCLVIGIFMTFYDVHINRIPLAGRLSYRRLPPIRSRNEPMLEVERSLIEDLAVARLHSNDYLRNNERMLNIVRSPHLDKPYWVLQIADADVDCILPFFPGQNTPVAQGARYSQIRYGSQVELVIPLSPNYGLKILQENHVHVEAGVDPLVQVVRAP